MNENQLTLTHQRGIKKMIGILVNMIQDHKIDDTYTLVGKDFKLRDIVEELVPLATVREYDDDTKDFLNEVRSLVLAYKDGRLDKQPWDDELTWAM